MPINLEFSVPINATLNPKILTLKNIWFILLQVRRGSLNTELNNFLNYSLEFIWLSHRIYKFLTFIISKKTLIKHE